MIEPRDVNPYDLNSVYQATKAVRQRMETHWHRDLQAKRRECDRLQTEINSCLAERDALRKELKAGAAMAANLAGALERILNASKAWLGKGWSAEKRVLAAWRAAQ